MKIDPIRFREQEHERFRREIEPLLRRKQELSDRCEHLQADLDELKGIVEEWYKDIQELEESWQ